MHSALSHSFWPFSYHQAYPKYQFVNCVSFYNFTTCDWMFSAYEVNGRSDHLLQGSQELMTTCLLAV